MNTSPATVIEKLRRNRNVDAAFVTGSAGIGKATKHSDIDLVVIIKRNPACIYAVYTRIKGVFADIFFFTHADLREITDKKDTSANEINAIFITWLEKADIQFDKSGKLTALKKRVLTPGYKKAYGNVGLEGQFSSWQKANYNFIQNMRYFNSANPVYHEALELRLLYSTIELVTAYFALRNIPWRGEKQAMSYFKEFDPTYHALLHRYFSASTLQQKMTQYRQLARRTFTKKYPPWNKDQIVAISEKHGSAKRQKEMLKYWRMLIK